MKLIEMSDVPKIVHHRLRSGRPSSGHPDANLLAAFAEQSLRPRERQGVLQHLSTCTDCRDILALSTPEFPTAAIATPSTRTGWLRWPALRWAAAAACVVVVGTAVSLRFGSQTHNTAPAAQSSSIPTAPAPEAKWAENVEPSVAKKSVPAGDAKSLDQRPAARALTAAALPASPQPAQPTEVTAESGAVTNAPEKLQSTDLEKRAAVAQAAPASSNEIALADTKTASRDEMSEVISGKAKDADNTKTVAKPDAMIGTLASSLSVPAKTEGQYRTDTPVVPRWKVSSDGILQRSLDSGQTWQPVSVATNVAFRAVANLGADVWAGGSAGILYHSSDSGRSWTQSTPSIDGQLLTADIVTITFRDPQHLQLTTATRETWLSQDAGQSWKKQ